MFDSILIRFLLPVKFSNILIQITRQVFNRKSGKLQIIIIILFFANLDGNKPDSINTFSTFRIKKAELNSNILEPYYKFIDTNNKS